MFMHQRHDEQQRPDGEDRLVLDRCRPRCRRCAVVPMNAVIVCTALPRVEREVGRRRRRRAARSSSRRRRGRRPARSRRRCRRSRRGRRPAVATCIFVAPSAVRALAQRARHRAHRVLGERGDDRHDHHADREPGDAGVEDGMSEPEERLASVGREEHQREEAEHDGRDAGQHLEHRLDDLAHARAARTRSGRSPTPRPSGTATSMPRGVIVSVPTTSGSTPKLRGREQRRPLRCPNRKSTSATSPKNPIVGAEQRDDDRRSS